MCVESQLWVSIFSPQDVRYARLAVFVRSTRRRSGTWRSTGAFFRRGAVAGMDKGSFASLLINRRAIDVASVGPF